MFCCSFLSEIIDYDLLIDLWTQNLLGPHPPLLLSAHPPLLLGPRPRSSSSSPPQSSSSSSPPPVSVTSSAAGWLDGASRGANQINADVSSDGWGASPATQHATLQRWNAAPLIIIHSRGLKGRDPSLSVALRHSFGGRSLFVGEFQPRLYRLNESHVFSSVFTAEIFI